MLRRERRSILQVFHELPSKSRWNRRHLYSRLQATFRISFYNNFDISSFRMSPVLQQIRNSKHNQIYIRIFFSLSLIWLLLGFLHNFYSTSSSCEVFLWFFYRNHYINKINWIKSSFRLQPVTINGNRLIEQRYERGTVWTYRVVVKR